MGEYIPARIQFGGNLRSEFVSELIDLLNASCLGTLETDDAPCLSNLDEPFYQAEIKSGDLADLEDFATRHDLSYEKWCESGSEWMATTTKFTAQPQRVAHVVGSQENGFYLSEDQLKTGAELLAWMKAPLPALEIVTAGTPVPTSPPAATPAYFVKITQVLRVQKSIIIRVDAEDQSDVLDMIEEGSLDVPSADNDTFDTWAIESSGVEFEIQEAV